MALQSISQLLVFELLRLFLVQAQRAILIRLTDDAGNYPNYTDDLYEYGPGKVKARNKEDYWRYPKKAMTVEPISSAL